MLATQLVAQPAGRQLRVHGLGAQDPADGLRPYLRRAAQHALPLVAELLDYDVGDLVDVGEHERRARLLTGAQLA
jgi:hypothetical protein